MLGNAAGGSLGSGIEADVVVLEQVGDLLVGHGADNGLADFLLFVVLAVFNGCDRVSGLVLFGILIRDRCVFLKCVTYFLHVLFVIGLGDLLTVAAASHLFAQLINISQVQKREVERLRRDLVA